MSSLIIGAMRFRQPAVLTIAFRPFFLLAALFAALGVPLWLHMRSGDIGYDGHLGGSLWHGHEMVFGFAVAVFAGFLLTAAQTWTGRTTARGAALGLLALLWIAGRAVLLLPDERLVWTAITIDLAFLPAAALLLLRPIVLAGNRRNLIFPLGLLVLAGLNLGVHLGALGRLDLDPGRLLWIALDLMALMMVIMGGRVIPFFSRNVLPRAGIGSWRAADMVAIGGTVAILGADIAVGGGPLLGVAALAAGAGNLARMLPWRGWTTRRQPILWILHVAYLWLPVAFLLRAAAGFDLLLPDAALHALSAGAVGALTLGMMSRVALGHSGRAIRAAPLTVAAYVLVVAAGVLRIGGTFQGEALMHLGAAAWILAWLCFLAVYAPICLARSGPGAAC